MKNCFKDGAITPEFIATSIAHHQVKTNIGAHQIFLGQVRNDLIDGKEVVAIDYSAHEKMANKAFHSIVEPVCEDLGVTLRTATPLNRVPREEMGKFYSENHVLICSSEHEGGPMPILESLASARPVISTNVGIVPEVVIPNQNGIIIQRSQTALKEAIQSLLSEPQKLKNMHQSLMDDQFTRYTEDMLDSYYTMFEAVMTTEV